MPNVSVKNESYHSEDIELIRAELISEVRKKVNSYQVTVLFGERGLGQVKTARQALSQEHGWELVLSNGSWLTGGYLSGFEEIVNDFFNWSEHNAPKLIVQHEQTLKRIRPARTSDLYRFPKDLTNSSTREERTRFYHYEYQNKLMVGLWEFMRDVLIERNKRVILLIEDSSELSPTSWNLINIILRNSNSDKILKMVFLDYDATLAIPNSGRICFNAYSKKEFFDQLGIVCAPHTVLESFYLISKGNLRIASTLKQCWECGISFAGHFRAESIVALYIASLTATERGKLADEHFNSGFKGSYLAERSAESLPDEMADLKNEQLHLASMEAYQIGKGPLVLGHALAIRNKYRRAHALVDPSEILMCIGLYDTWLSFFGSMFIDLDLRLNGNGNGPVNRMFINAAFVLYAMGNSRTSTPFLEEFLSNFPESCFVPTALYAQSMTYGRYQTPANLDLAEEYALRNIELINTKFQEHEKYRYIKAFADNAYAYIKARRGKLDEALALCENADMEIIETYGDDRFRLHRSILTYNISQIYEIAGNFIQAEIKLRQTIEIDPYYAEYYNDLGNLLARAGGRNPEAIEAYGYAISLSPPYYEAYLNRGVLLNETGDVISAIADFDRVLEIKPDEWRAWREIGNSFLAQGNAITALNAYAKAMMYENSDPDLLANVGLAHSEAGNTESAILHYHAALKINPKHPEAHNNLAAELIGQGKLEEALVHADLASRYGINMGSAVN